MRKKGNGKRHGLVWVGGSATPSKIYITRVFNFGTWEEWKKMKRRFDEDEIEEAVKNPLRGEWTKRGKVFAETLYGCRIPKEAIISYEA